MFDLAVVRRDSALELFRARSSLLSTGVDLASDRLGDPVRFMESMLAGD